MRAYKAEYRSLTRRMDYWLVGESIKEAAAAAKSYFIAIGLFGRPFSRLLVRRIHNPSEALLPQKM